MCPELARPLAHLPFVPPRARLPIGTSLTFLKEVTTSLRIPYYKGVATSLHTPCVEWCDLAYPSRSFNNTPHILCYSQGSAGCDGITEQHGMHGVYLIFFQNVDEFICKQLRFISLISIEVTTRVLQCYSKKSFCDVTFLGPRL